MPDEKNCGNTEPHMFHPFEDEVEVRCPGQTRCGDQYHVPHTFTEVQKFWCNGICTCGMLSRGVHGPGAHK